MRNLTQSSRLAGRAYSDLNNNGSRDNGEPVLAGVQVYVDANQNGSYDAGEQTTTTDSTGFWQIDALNPYYTATFHVRAVAPSGLTQTAPANNGDDVITINAGNGVLPTDVFGFVDRTPPSVINRTLAVQTATQPQFVFDEPVVYSGGVFSATFSTTLSNSTVPFSFVNVAASCNTLTLSFPNLSNQHLPAGIYRATLAANTVADAVGNVVSSPLTFDFLVAGSGETLTAPASATTYIVQAVAMAATAKFDLNNNDLIDDYSGATPQAPAIAALINSARAGGAWSGNGITSSAAKSNTAHDTTLGAMESSDYQSIYGPLATFDGKLIDPTAVLIKYTYYGDADFNGQVNFDDYSRIDKGYALVKTGWVNGDFNENGAVNFDDYSLIDTAFTLHGNPFASSAAAIVNNVVAKAIPSAPVKAPTKGATL